MMADIAPTIEVAVRVLKCGSVIDLACSLFAPVLPSQIQIKVGGGACRRRLHLRLLQKSHVITVLTQ